MRKRLLNWLVAFYLFVIQIVIVANLWQDSRLYILAGINFLVLIFFATLFSLSSKKNVRRRSDNVLDKSKHSNNHYSEKKSIKSKGSFGKKLYYFFQHYLFVIVLVLLPVVIADNILFNISHINVWRIVILFVFLFFVLLKAIVQKKIFFIHKQFGTRSILFVLSIFVMLLFYSVAENIGIKSRFAVVISIFLAFLLFILFIKIFKARRMQKLGSFWSIRLYIIAFIISIVVYLLGGYLDIAKQEKYVDEQPRLYAVWETVVDKTQNIFSKDVTKVTIVSGLDVELPDLELSDTDLSTGAGQVLTANFAGGTGDTVNVFPEPFGATLRNEDSYANDDPLKYVDVIIYLLEDKQIDLATDDYNISFKYLSKYNEDYIYFKTAYSKKLIGTALKPNAKVKCDNYLVMKGILENWDVSDKSGNIFDKYFSKADDLGVLNGCVRGKYLTKLNL